MDRERIFVHVSFIFSQMKTIHITVKVCIPDNADAYEVAENCDYSFTHEDILSTEIVNVCDEKNVDVF